MIRVLIADDHPVVRSGLAGMLAVEPDLEVVGEAADGEEAVALATGLRPDLVLMDYHLDQTSGLDAIEWLRQNVGGHLPAALLTADRSPQVRALAEVRGVAVITKPVKPGDTIHAVIKVLEKRETSNPERGVMKRELKVLNQRGEVVQEALQAFLLKRKPAA